MFFSILCIAGYMWSSKIHACALSGMFLSCIFTFPHTSVPKPIMKSSPKSFLLFPYDDQHFWNNFSFPLYLRSTFLSFHPVISSLKVFGSLIPVYPTGFSQVCPSFPILSDLFFFSLVFQLKWL